MKPLALGYGILDGIEIRLSEILTSAPSPHSDISGHLNEAFVQPIDCLQGPRVGEGEDVRSQPYNVAILSV